MDQAKEAKYLQTLQKASDKIKELIKENESLKYKEPIAIIGIGCRYPGGISSPEDFWQVLRDGVDTVTEIPAERWDVNQFYDAQPDKPGKTYTKYGAFVNNIHDFDSSFFGITPREAEALDPQQRLLLEVSWEAFENAGLEINRLKGSPTGVFIGTANYDFYKAEFFSGDVARISPHTASGVMVSVMAGRLAYFYDFHGPALAVDTACSSSLVSLHLAVASLLRGECQLALAGGVNILLSPEGYIALSKAKALSPEGRCRSFDNSANGYGRGEGCGLVVLKRLSQALQDGDRIYSLIKGVAVNHDGRSNGLTAPNGPAQCQVIQSALHNATLTPDAIDYIEAHGTGTILGDPIEVNALNTVFGKTRTKDNPLWIGSVKTNIGHTEAAAGIASVIKVALSLQHQQIPPSLHVSTLNQHIPWNEIPIQVATSLLDWPAQQHPKAAGISSFGLSGTNAHVVMEEYQSAGMDERSAPSRSVSILPISARTESALKEYANRCQKMIRNNDISLTDVCYTASVGRSHFPERLAFVVSSCQELTKGLESYQNGTSDSMIVHTKKEKVLGNQGLVFLFTGQGAQYIGMGRGLYETEAVFRSVIDKCNDVVRNYLNKPLIDYLYAPDARDEVLGQTSVTQPAMIALELALVELWRSWGVIPAAVIGHSIGEFAAAYASGILGLEDAVRLAAERGRMMQALAPVGAMAAVMASEDVVQEAISPYKGQISIAAVNAPERITITGLADCIATCMQEFKKLQISSQILAVSHAFHSSLMEPMMPEFKAVGFHSIV